MGFFLGPCWQCLPALIDVQGQGERGAHSEDQFELFALLCQRKAKVHALGFQGRVLSIRGAVIDECYF